MSLDAVKQWLSDIQKDVYVLGPLLPPGYGAKMQDNEEGTSVEIETFLGKMLAQHGKRSVFFVKSFLFFSAVELHTLDFFRFPLVLSTGHQYRNTLTNWLKFWLQRKHHLYVDGCYSCSILWFKVCTEQILAHASQRATLSEQLVERVQSSGLGIITKWCPQQFILNHSVLHPNCYLSGLNIWIPFRRLDGLLRMEVLIVLLNLLRAAYLRKDFIGFTNSSRYFTLFVEFTGLFLQTSQLLLYMSPKTSMQVSNFSK